MFANFFNFLDDDYFFNRCGIYDMHPYQAVEKDGNLIITLNTLGINPKDINVEAEEGDAYFPQYLKVSGKTLNELTGKEYNINMRLGIRKEIAGVDVESRDGLTYLQVKFNEPVKPKISISNKKLLAG
jgi:HSP20 family molecular chaperone IbpA